MNVSASDITDDLVRRDQSYIHGNDPTGMCDAWSCSEAAHNQCTECGKEFCSSHILTENGNSMCNDCHRDYLITSAECPILNCSSDRSQTCVSCGRGFCDDHVVDYDGLQCMHCIGEHRWHEFKLHGKCEMDGCSKMNEHTCCKCEKGLCHEHVAKTDVSLLSSADFCYNCQ